MSQDKTEKTTLLVPVDFATSYDLFEALTAIVENDRIKKKLRIKEMKALLEFYSKLEGAINTCAEEQNERDSL